MLAEAGDMSGTTGGFVHPRKKKEKEVKIQYLLIFFPRPRVVLWWVIGVENEAIWQFYYVRMLKQ